MSWHKIHGLIPDPELAREIAKDAHPVGEGGIESLVALTHVGGDCPVCSLLQSYLLLHASHERLRLRVEELEP